MLVFDTPAPGLPCSWDVSVTCCSNWDTYSADVQTAAAEAGALVVWAATGRRFGLCTRTVRPCGRFCQSSGIYGYWWGEGTWFPYVFDGIWRNCWCSSSSTPGCECSCEPRCQVYLPGPVASIPATGVSVNDAIIPVDSWRVDNGKWLVRTDGECWPECQDYNVDSGDNTMFVTYQMGLPVPSSLLVAAGTYACEWAKSCTAQACTLPQRAASIARQGVTVSLTTVRDLLDRGLTGIPSVDQIIAAMNPGGLKSPMTIASPDMPVTRVTTYP